MLGIETNQGSAAGEFVKASTDSGWRIAALLTLDMVAWTLALGTGAAFYEMSATSSAALTLLGIALLAHAMIGAATGLYRGRFRQYSFEEAGAVAVTAGATGIIVIIAEYSLRNAPRAGQLVVVSTSLAVCLMFAHRYLRRQRARRVMRRSTKHRRAVIVYGAGNGGESAIRTMQSAARSEYRPVAIIDDHRAMRNRRIGGVRVEGGVADLRAIARRHGAESVLLAVPSAPVAELRALHLLVQEAGLETLVMPPLQRLVTDDGPPGFSPYSDAEVLRRNTPGIDTSGRPDADTSALEVQARGPHTLVTDEPESIGPDLFRPLSHRGPTSPERLSQRAGADDLALGQRILMLGAGGHARVCLEAIRDGGFDTVVGAVCADAAEVTTLGVPVLGRDVDARNIARRVLATTFCVAIGNNTDREHHSRVLIESGHRLTEVISPGAIVSSSATLKDGVQLLAAAVVNASTSIGVGTIVNTNASVDHDCHVGDFVHIAPGVTIGGDVRIGDRAVVGLGARVLPGVTIGNDAVVGAGAVVVCDVEPGTTVVGIPARPVGDSAS